MAVAPEQFRLKTRTWSHLAGVYDGKSVRLFINGKEVGRSSASGSRLTNMLPLVVGGDVAEDGSMMSPFEGRLEEVRLSKVARYTQDFAPADRHASDDDTLLLLPCDVAVGASCPIVQPEGSRRGHGVGQACPFGPLKQAAELGEQLADHSAFDIGQAEITASVSVGQSFVVESQQGQDRGVQIMNMDLVVLGVVAPLVRRAK